MRKLRQLFHRAAGCELPVCHDGDAVAQRLAQQALNPKSKLPTPQPSRDILRLEEEIADRLGATVKIKANKKGAGAVTIQFGDLDQLEGLLEKLR